VQGEGWLFRGLDVHVGPRDRLALIGRNGAGKTTLLKCLAGTIDTDDGKRSGGAGQEDRAAGAGSADGGHATPGGVGAERRRTLRQAHEAAAIADQLGVDLTRSTATASRGRAAAGGDRRALAQEPDLLFLDEPTNHLDLRRSTGWKLAEPLHRAFIVISHDRTFLTRLTKSCLWLDRGQIRRAEVGFGGLRGLDRAVYAEEQRAAEKLDAKLAIELHWLQRGVTARRRSQPGAAGQARRNAEARAAMIGGPGVSKLGLAKDDAKTKTVIDAEGVTKRFTLRQLVPSAVEAQGPSTSLGANGETYHHQGLSPCASSAATGSGSSGRTARARPLCSSC
jgi:ATP-binding cassette subfamily F protein uup